MKHLNHFIIALILITSFVFILKVSASRQFIADCYEWQEYEAQFILFELEPDIADACEDVGVSIK